MVSSSRFTAWPLAALIALAGAAAAHEAAAAAGGAAARAAEVASACGVEGEEGSCEMAASDETPLLQVKSSQPGSVRLVGERPSKEESVPNTVVTAAGGGPLDSIEWPKAEVEFSMGSTHVKVETTIIALPMGATVTKEDMPKVLPDNIRTTLTNIMDKIKQGSTSEMKIAHEPAR
uniref:Uncharacterized protein n=1 Tax=Alexandrium catenella TaxID=2925 RepID=A0A7S1SBX8_ALECA|mmetsp:Transcript_94726/g.251596  ORF Transcript_94726/g.251596 Transcript_94726/m.251596 type:complete len:176 (+) Transcript_94726:78-605(+)